MIIFTVNVKHLSHKTSTINAD